MSSSSENKVSRSGDEVRKTSSSDVENYSFFSFGRQRLGFGGGGGGVF